MKSKIKINGEDLKWFTFSGGEVQVKVNTETGGNVVVQAWLHDSEGVMALLMANDVLRSLDSVTSVTLLMFYVPYGRQDRACAKGEAFALKVFADLINYANFDKVYVADPHSPITTELLDRSVVMNYKLPDSSLRETDFLVAPDKGATERVAFLSELYDIHWIQAHKKRNPSTGELSGFGYIGDVKGKNLLLVDDICDGGGTFVGLADKLLKGGAKSVSLYVTHGIFSKGIDVLINGGISHIYTTRSVNNNIEHKQLTRV